MIAGLPRHLNGANGLLAGRARPVVQSPIKTVANAWPFAPAIMGIFAVFSIGDAHRTTNPINCSNFNGRRI